MSESAFRLFNEAFSLAAELLYAACFTLFLRPFLKPQTRARTFCLFAGYLLLCLSCDALPLPQGSFGPLLIALLTALAPLAGLERGAAFLLTLLYGNARVSSGLMIESAYFLLERALPLPSEPPGVVYLRACMLVTLFLVCHASLMAAMLCLLRRLLQTGPGRFCIFPQPAGGKLYGNWRIGSRWREVLCLSLVPGAGILFGQMIARILIEYRDGVLLQLYERHPGFIAAVPVLAALFYAGACLTIAFWQDMAALREEQAAWFVERQQTRALRARIRDMEQLYASTRALRHELRGHLNNIQGLARDGAVDSLKGYIARMDESMRQLAPPIPTGNPVTDVIVGDIQRQCLPLGIAFTANFRYPAQGAYDAFDMAVILQNLLQNAVEACEKAPADGRSITLTGRRKGRFFLIEVKNTFAGKVVFGPDGLPLTTKAGDASLHGIGLANVRREAETYMGELELKAVQQEFSATVLLQERSSI